MTDIPVSAPTTPVSSEAATESSASPEISQAQAEAKRYKVKVDGQEMDVDESELINNYQLRKAADKKMNEAAQLRKQAETFIDMLRTDPIKVLSNPNLGVNFRELAEQYLVQQLEEEMLDPRDRELKQYKKLVEEQQAKERNEQQRIEAERAEALKAKYTDTYSRDITTALSEGGLPKTAETVKRIAQYLHLGLQSGVELSAKDVVPFVKQDYIKAQRELFGASNEDMLLQLLGDDVAGKLRKADLKRLKPQTEVQPPAKQAVKDGVSQPAVKKIDKDTWRARLERIKNGEDV